MARRERTATSNHKGIDASPPAVAVSASNIGSSITVINDPAPMIKPLISNANPTIEPSDVPVHNSPPVSSIQYTNNRNMTSFLDDVHCDHKFEVEAKYYIEQSIQALSSEVKTLKDDLKSDAIQIARMKELSRQKQREIRQRISNCERLTREQNEQLLKSQHRISCLVELEYLEGPLEIGKFPEEIRRMIFELVLVTNAPIDFVGDCFISCPPPAGWALFRTSKQFHREAIAVFHSQNKFAMKGTDLERFLSQNNFAMKGTNSEQSLLPRRIDHVRSLSINLDRGILINEVLQAIERCKDLRSLHIDLSTRPLFRRGSGNGAEECMRSLTFKRPESLGQISTVWRVSPLENLELLCCILQNVLEGGGPEKPSKPLRKSPRLSSQDKPSDSNRR